MINNHLMLGIFADQLEHYIQYNDIHYDQAIGTEHQKHYGYQLQPKTVDFSKDIVRQLRRLEKYLREYDWRR